MKIIKKLLGLFAVIFVLFSITSCNNNKKFKFEYWNDCDSLKTLTTYVENVTKDKLDDNFIPVEDRIAVFDMDGTLCGELFPTYLEYLLECIISVNFERMSCSKVFCFFRKLCNFVEALSSTVFSSMMQEKILLLTLLLV